MTAQRIHASSHKPVKCVVCNTRSFSYCSCHVFSPTRVPRYFQCRNIQNPVLGSLVKPSICGHLLRPILSIWYHFQDRFQQALPSLCPHFKFLSEAQHRHNAA
ncbi:hypothetical protein D6C97_02209 [Aureobasidium pullulans]|nr:hypothetical protein D6C97_02209 [Aureobasidium pullulans]